MPANPLAPLLEAAGPRPVDAPSFRYATVTGTGPLRVRLDGEDAAVASTPTTLVPVAVGDRVRVMLYHRQLEILGLVGGNSPWVTCESGPSVTGGTVRARREGDSVRLDGRLTKDAGWGHGHHAFTLPAGHRPATAKFLLAEAGGGATTVPPVLRISVLPTGLCYAQNAPAGTTSFSINVTFVAD